ncbi:MAG: hypothetical protein ACREFZ_00910 [Acetobacteraceae bacterium]
MLEALQRRYHETVRWIGADELGTSDVLTVAPGGTTWTLLAIGEAGGESIACMIDSGGAGRRSATS